MCLHFCKISFAHKLPPSNKFEIWSDRRSDGLQDKNPTPPSLEINYNYSRARIIWPSLIHTSRIIRVIIIHTIVYFPIDFQCMDNLQKMFTYFLCELSGLHCTSESICLGPVQTDRRHLELQLPLRLNGNHWFLCFSCQPTFQPWFQHYQTDKFPRLLQYFFHFPAFFQHSI